jgi:hypothetical protein
MYDKRFYALLAVIFLLGLFLGLAGRLFVVFFIVLLVLLAVALASLARRRR